MLRERGLDSGSVAYIYALCSLLYIVSIVENRRFI